VAARFAASLALLAFFALCLRGAIRGDAFDAVIGKGLVAMALMGAVGQIIGTLAQHAVRESVDREIQEIEERQRLADGAPADDDQQDAQVADASAQWPPNTSQTQATDSR